jgi:hypothetical protein
MLDGIDIPDEVRTQVKKHGLRGWLLSQAREQQEATA